MGPIHNVTYAEEIEQPNRRKKHIRFDDLKNNYVVIGRLGIPAGTLVTIRGTWTYTEEKFKTEPWSFSITELDGKKLTEPIVHQGRVISGSPFPHQENDPVDGDTWELRAFESVMHYGSPDGWHEETGAQRSPGFMRMSLVSEIYYIKRKIEKAGETTPNEAKQKKGRGE